MPGGRSLGGWRLGPKLGLPLGKPLALTILRTFLACGMFVAEHLLFTCTTETKETDAYNKIHCSLLSGHYSVFFWCDLDLSYIVYNKSRRQWALNIHFHKLGFHFLTSSVSLSSNLACTVIVTQQQFVDWWKLILPLVVWFQTGYSIKWEYFWIKS